MSKQDQIAEYYVEEAYRNIQDAIESCLEALQKVW